MGKPIPRRKLQSIDSITSTPPSSLPPSHLIARIIKAAGNNLYLVSTPQNEELLVELESKFRSSVWLRRNGFVLVDRGGLADRENKIRGEIVNVVRGEKEWRKMGYWPKEFGEVDRVESDDDDDEEEEEDVRGKMPPADESDTEN